MPKLTKKHREDLQAYVNYYKGQEATYGDKGWPMSIAHAIEAALARIDALEGNPAGTEYVCAACGAAAFKLGQRCANCGHAVLRPRKRAE